MAGWSYEDWRGIVYPASPPTGFDPLAYLAPYLDCIEVNSSFYRPPSRRTVASWVTRTAHLPDFSFTLKLWQRFTHGRQDTGFVRDAREFRDAMAPLAKAGRCGALLVQFPWSFRRTRENATWLKRVVQEFAESRPVVEVRHASWDAPGVRSWLDEHRVGLCSVDQPLFEGSLGPAPFATGRRGYVRFHGRNRANWFREDAQTHERYDYLYSEEELDPWLARIREIAGGADQTFVITNNHYRGQALVNALQIKAALQEEAVPAPEPLRAAYPQLAGVTIPMTMHSTDPGEPGLFD